MKGLPQTVALSFFHSDTIPTQTAIKATGNRLQTDAPSALAKPFNQPQNPLL
jgi:hypothetical protein